MAYTLVKMKKRRQELGLTQGELGAKVGVSQWTIGNIENRHTKDIKSDHMIKIAEVLGCHPWQVREFFPAIEYANPPVSTKGCPE